MMDLETVGVFRGISGNAAEAVENQNFRFQNFFSDKLNKHIYLIIQ